MRITTLVLALLVTISTRAATTVVIDAGKFDRSDCVVTFAFPASLDPKGNYGLVKNGLTLPVQMLPGNQATFVLRELKAGQSLTFALEAIPWATRPPIATDVTAKEEETNVKITVGDKTLLRYNGKATPLPDGFEPQYQRGGYLFPLLTPSGRVVCDDYPPMHKHHHGIWFAWTSTQFEGRKPDFWNMGQKRGTVEFVKLGSPFSGPVAAGLQTSHRYLDLTAPGGAKPVLNEKWDVTAYGIGTTGAGAVSAKPYFVFDIDCTQTCAGDAPLKLPKYHYGGIGFRGHRDWNVKAPDAYTALTSEGKDRQTSNETTCRWVHMGGKVEGELVGLAMLGHPSNFRFPQPVRVHPGEPYFCFAPQQAGDFEIAPGKPYVSKHRVVITDGAADAKLYDRLWNDYATPPVVTVK